MELFYEEKAGEEGEYTALFALLETLKTGSKKAYSDTWHALHYGYSEHQPVRPPLAAIQRFLQKVVHNPDLASDRLDPDAAVVFNAAWKVMHEFDRLRGLLRFSPEPEPREMPDSKPAAGRIGEWYIARCTPDHFVLPLFADHFWQRFGSISWAIIDERRNYILYSDNGNEPVCISCDSSLLHNKETESSTGQDQWEKLWKNYHTSINNESRYNPQLQKQFMPRRYWKYLPEAPSAE